MEKSKLESYHWPVRVSKRTTWMLVLCQWGPLYLYMTLSFYPAFESIVQGWGIFPKSGWGLAIYLLLILLLVIWSFRALMREKIRNLNSKLCFGYALLVGFCLFLGLYGCQAYSHYQYEQDRVANESADIMQRTLDWQDD